MRIFETGGVGGMMNGQRKKLKIFCKIFYPKYSFSAVQDLIISHCGPNSQVLEIGAGSGKGMQTKINLRGRVKRVVGIDLDPRVLENSSLDESYQMDVMDIGEKLARKFDVIFSVMVVEHIEDPRRFLDRQLELLTPGGVLIHYTVSRYSPVSMIANWVPEWLKLWLIQTLGSGRTKKDVFKTFYRLNSASDVRKYLDSKNAKLIASYWDGPPGYLRRSFILMFVYWVFHKPFQYLFPMIRPNFVFVVFKIPQK